MHQKEKKIDFSKRFHKQLKRAPQNVKTSLRHQLELFLEDSHHPSLRNHALKDKYSGYKSIDVTSDWRALFRESSNTIFFDFLGTHSQLYK